MRENSSFGVVSFLMFPTEISDNTTVSIETGGNNKGEALFYLTIVQGDNRVRLDLKESRTLAEIIGSVKESTKDKAKE